MQLILSGGSKNFKERFPIVVGPRHMGLGGTISSYQQYFNFNSMESNFFCSALLDSKVSQHCHIFTWLLIIWGIQGPLFICSYYNKITNGDIIAAINSFIEIIKEARTDGLNLGELLKTSLQLLEKGCLNHALLAAIESGNPANVGKLIFHGAILMLVLL